VKRIPLFALRQFPSVHIPAWFGILLLASAASAVGCGKVGDPVAPTPRAAFRANALSVMQRGDQLLLNFALTRPARAQQLDRVDVYRVIETPTNAPDPDAEDFVSRSTVIASIGSKQFQPLARSSEGAVSYNVSYTDALDLKPMSTQMRYRYAVRAVNRSGVAGSLSNYALISPLAGIASPPDKPSTRVTETGIEVSWTAPASNENGSQPVNLIGYNLYRNVGGVVSKLNDIPLTQPGYVDRAFQWGVSYGYTLRALSAAPPGGPVPGPIESNESAAAVVVPRDVFPPAAPGSITIASINGTIFLFWPANSEPDTQGYNVYRSESEQAPQASWVKVNPRLVTTMTFRDDRVDIGKRYFYQLTAVDSAGNESARSETKTEVTSP